MQNSNSRLQVDPDFNIDPWEKAAECVRARETAQADPDRWAMLTELQQMWTNLANQRQFLTPEELASAAEKIGNLHVELGGWRGPAMH